MENFYKLLEHPSDIGFEVKGNSFIEALKNATKALYDIIIDGYNYETNIYKEINIQAIDKEALVFKWLNEILYLFDSDSFIGNKIEISMLKYSENNVSIIGKIYGKLFDPSIHSIKVQVKAVTYHQFELFENKNEVTIRVFLDI